MSWAIEYFLDMITAERGASPHTIDAYRRDLSQFYEFSGISEKEVELYNKWLKIIEENI